MIRSTNRVDILIPLLFAVLTASTAPLVSHAQTSPATSGQSVTAATPTTSEPLNRQELLRQIGIYEDAARDAAAVHPSRQSLVKIYASLGILYEDVGMYARAEASTRRAIESMKDGSQGQLAEEINRLSILHSLMGNLHEAEKDQKRALAICEEIGDPVCIALTWTHLASLYYKERQMKKSLEYAQKAYSVLNDQAGLKASDRLAVLEAMAFALCGTHHCIQAIPIMKDAVVQAQSAYGDDSLSAGLAYYVLGYAYWQCKDTADAAEWMGRGIKRLKVDLGWGNSLYVDAMEQYANFLRQTGQREEAHNTESEVHRIESVVDARALTTRGGEFLSSGTR